MSSVKCVNLEEELKKNPELKISDIKILKEWCGKQPHLPVIQDVVLAIFLHSNYYHIEPTKTMIENYYTYRTHTPEIFSNKDILKVKRLRDAFKVTATLHLKSKTKEEYNIMAVRLFDTDPSHFFLNEMVTSLIMVCEEVVWSYGSSPGYIYVADGANATIGHIGRINITVLRKFILYVQDAAPIRLKALHVINVSPIIEMLFNMLKPFINEDLMALIHLHSSSQSASEYFPMEALPNEFGGKAGAMQDLMNVQLKKVEHFREWYLNDEKYNRVNELRRIRKSNASNKMCSMNGSFKKLEID